MISQPSSASVLYRWTNPKHKTDGLGEEEFAERLICREKPGYCSKFDRANEKWSLDGDLFHRSAMGHDLTFVPGGLTKSYKYFVGVLESAAMFVDDGELEECCIESKLSHWGSTRPPIKESCDLRIYKLRWTPTSSMQQNC